MAVKETIAFIGEKEKTCPVLVKKLAQEDFRLLFVFNEGAQIDELSEQLNLEETPTEIELINCAKDGCWEADIIAFINRENFETTLIEKIKEVATQKIVLCISAEKNLEIAFSETQVTTLQQSLPHSKIVQVNLNSEEMKARVSGENKEALEAISVVFEKIGYKNHRVEIKK